VPIAKIKVLDIRFRYLFKIILLTSGNKFSGNICQHSAPIIAFFSSKENGRKDNFRFLVQICNLSEKCFSILGKFSEKSLFFKKMMGKKM